MTEYALNAVNQGVTSLGIKGMASKIYCAMLLMLIFVSYQWYSPGHGEENFHSTY